RIFEEKLDPKYDDKKRFETMATKVQGQLRDIDNLLPEAYLTSQRSNTSSRIRRVAGADIFECSKVDLLLPDVRLEKFREQIGWYIEEGTSGGYSSLDVPILHKDWSGEYNIKTCFLHPCLMRLYATLIRGPTAATIMLQHASDSNVVVTIPNSENMQRILAIDHTEPGAIAGSAVLAIWALSADGDLRDKGDRTGIDYDALYDQYLEILTTGLRNRSRSIVNVFSEWDRVVFPTSQSG
ncbi:hypothetical protein C8R44DRAFT_535106, partial [Mycena epipterygia]